MALMEMIVTGSDGKIHRESEVIEGKILTKANDPYVFYAVSGLEETELVAEVQIIMPLGGAESGLFRQPRVGERVLVAREEGQRNYLVGYVPDKTGKSGNSFSAPNAEEKAELFRYQKTGNNTSDDAYSEIGFYRKETRWRQEASPDSGADSGAPPKIDRISIRSTGDIHSRAQNHHGMRAKRLELLADCEGIEAEGARAFGDGEGDDSRLYAGDAHIRAKNRLVLKAGQELRLQAGRSAIVISDDGITITSKKTQKNVAVPWDTVINLTPRDGITMFGQNVNVGAAYNFSLRESAGGAVSSLGGVMRLSARDLLAQSYCKVGYQANMTDFIKLYTATSKAMQSGKGDVPSFTSLLPSLVAVFANINWGYYSTTTNYSDPAGDYAAYCGTLLQILSLTYTSLDLSMDEEMKAKNGGRDAFNLAALADQQEKVQEMLSSIDGAGDPSRAIHNSFMHLTSSADAVLSGFDNERLSVNVIDSNVPLAGTNASLIAKETARLQKENSAEATLRAMLKDNKQQIEDGILWSLGMGGEIFKKLQEL
jgi:hypothetical protein